MGTEDSPLGRLVERIRDHGQCDPARAYRDLGLDLVEAGDSRWRATCPLHADGVPSLTVSAQSKAGQRGVWYCFPCQKGGDLIGLWRLMHPGMEFPEAVRALAGRLGLGGADTARAPRPPPPKPPPKPKKSPPSPDRVLRAWCDCDRLVADSPEANYLSDRDLDWQWLSDAGLVRALPAEPLEWPHGWWRDGFVRRQDGRAVFGLGRAIVVPVVGSDTAYVALHARSIATKAFRVSARAPPGLIEGPGLVNLMSGNWRSPGVPGWLPVVAEIWVAEGLTDTLAAACAVRNDPAIVVCGVVGSMGPSGLAWLPRGPSVRLLFDPDDAGRKLAHRAWEALKQRAA